MNTFIEIPATKKSLGKRKLVFSVGINDAKYITKRLVNSKTLTCPYYRKWGNMLERCYSAKFHKKHPTYKDCSVTKEWLTFSVFREWMKTKDWKGCDLDKDLLVQNNKLYSPETCLLVESKINKMLNDTKNSRGVYPRGVSFYTTTNKFASKVRVKGKNKHIGYFNTSEEAFEAYKKEKYSHIKQVALEQSEPLRSALLRYEIA